VQKRAEGQKFASVPVYGLLLKQRSKIAGVAQVFIHVFGVVLNPVIGARVGGIVFFNQKHPAVYKTPGGHHLRNMDAFHPVQPIFANIIVNIDGYIVQYLTHTAKVHIPKQFCKKLVLYLCSMKARVVVGLSGGVDSSVAAYLLKQQGYEVIGIFMKNWHDSSVTISDDCPWEDDSRDALLIAEQLDIPFQTIDLSEEYRKRIVDYMFAEYEAGRTPNPDVLCNREIKFDVFLKAAMSLGADYVATGHYCRKEAFEQEGKTRFRLLSGKDPNKDQSYFLCQISEEQLSKALFPIGELLKPEVRRIAEEAGLVTASKKDSQGLCFIGKVRLPDFLQQQLKPKEGDIVEIPADSPLYAETSNRDPETLSRVPDYTPSAGKKVGTHRGAHFFTIGQRKGLLVGGKEEPLFVIATDVHTNTLYTGMGEHHPGLNRQALFISKYDLHWLRPDEAMQEGEERSYLVRIRYRQPLQKARLIQKAQGLYIVFETLQKGITPGQFAAWYDGEELVGSGVIG
jgi:tRNA-specific 2-thiouridylase